MTTDNKDANQMTSSKPYFFRAIYDWIEDNGLTTHIIVDTSINDVDVPSEYINNGEIVLNISSSSIQLFENNNDLLSFEARFNGRLTPIFVPINAIKAVFARENQQGIFFNGGLVGEQFDIEESDATKTPTEVSSSDTNKENSGASESKKKDKKSSHLKIIK